MVISVKKFHAALLCLGGLDATAILHEQNRHKICK